MRSNDDDLRKISRKKLYITMGLLIGTSAIAGTVFAVIWSNKSSAGTTNEVPITPVPPVIDDNTTKDDKEDEVKPPKDDEVKPPKDDDDQKVDDTTEYKSLGSITSTLTNRPGNKRFVDWDTYDERDITNLDDWGLTRQEVVALIMAKNPHAKIDDKTKISIRQDSYDFDNNKVIAKVIIENDGEEAIEVEIEVTGFAQPKTTKDNPLEIAEGEFAGLYLGGRNYRFPSIGIKDTMGKKAFWGAIFLKHVFVSSNLGVSPFGPAEFKMGLTIGSDIHWDPGAQVYKKHPFEDIIYPDNFWWYDSFKTPIMKDHIVPTNKINNYNNIILWKADWGVPGSGVEDPAA